MIPVQYIVVACWAIFALYWFISASSVKPTQETKGWLAGNWHSIWLLIGGLLISNASFLAEVGVPSSWLTVLLIPSSIDMNVVIVVFAVSGLIVAMVARRTLAGNWSRAVAFKKDHEMITAFITTCAIRFTQASYSWYWARHCPLGRRARLSDSSS